MRADASWRRPRLCSKPHRLSRHAVPIAASVFACLVAGASSAQIVTEFTYDTHGRLTGVDRQRPECEGNKATAYSYDDAHNRLSRLTTNTQSCVNNVPVATDDAISVNIRSTFIFSPVANDQDPDGDSLVVDSFGQCGNSVCVVARHSATELAVTGYDDRTNSFTYTVSDGKGGFDQGTVTVTVLDN